MHLLEGLNQAQRRAVELNDDHLLVVAGAGSGKTRVLTHKIAHLIDIDMAHPDGILAMTFSNKAAREMQSRIGGLLPHVQTPQWVGTFHAISLRLIKEFHELLDLPRSFSIYDEADQISLLKKIMKSLNMDPKYLNPKTIRGQLDWAKNQTTNIEAFLKNEAHLSDQALEVALAYQTEMHRNHALDFGDLLSKTLLLLEKHRHVKETLQARWQRILIDEYQDTNLIQRDLILNLTGPETIVCAVGDEDQSIYSWRGACVENMLEFEQDFKGAQTVMLDQNYRSNENILQAANAVISNNTGRRDKRLWTQDKTQNPVKFSRSEDDYREARWVLDHVQHHRQSGINLDDMAILYRTHAQSRLLEDEARKRGVPYRIVGGVRFYDRLEIKDTLAFLRLALNPRDNVSFERIVNKPARGIGAKTLERLSETAFSAQISMLEAIPLLSGGAKAVKALHLFYDWFATFQLELSKLTASEAAEHVLDASGYLNALETEASVEADARVENLEELLRSMAEFDASEEGGLPAFLDQVALISDLDHGQVDEHALTLMTLHHSKGLEFDAVFMVGLEEGIFPHQRSIESEDPMDMEEERRLCYVGMTRAKKHLALTAAERRRLYRFTQYNPISRFIDEIPSPPKLELGASMGNRSGSWDKTHARSKGSYQPRHGFSDDDFSQASYADDLPAYDLGADIDDSTGFRPGAEVFHPKFGQGVIKRSDGPTDNLKLTIAFQTCGIKKIMLNYCDLKVLSS